MENLICTNFYFKQFFEFLPQESYNKMLKAAGGSEILNPLINQQKPNF